MVEPTTVQAQVLAVVRSSKRSRVRAWTGWLVGVLLVVATAGGIGVWRWRASAEAEPRYISASSKRGDLQATITATGSLEALGQVEVGAEVSGRIAAVHVDFNDRVKAGQVLCELDPEQWRAARKQAAAQLQASLAEANSRKASRAKAELALTRARALADKGLVAQQELELAIEADAQSFEAMHAALAQVELARASLESAETSLAKTTIVSPIDGVVLSRTVEPGQTVAATFAAPVLFTLARDLTQMELHIDIDEADIPMVAEGQRAWFTVDGHAGREFPAELTSIHNIATTQDNVVTYEAVLKVDNGALALRPGMTATVTIVTAERSDATLVPNAALRFTPPSEIEQRQFGMPMFGQRPAAPAADEDETALLPNQAIVWVPGTPPRPVQIEVGLTDGEWTEVLGGDLAADAEVLVDVITKKR